MQQQNICKYSDTCLEWPPLQRPFSLWSKFLCTNGIHANWTCLEKPLGWKAHFPSTSFKGGRSWQVALNIWCISKSFQHCTPHARLSCHALISLTFLQHSVDFAYSPQKVVPDVPAAFRHQCLTKITAVPDLLDLLADPPEKWSEYTDHESSVSHLWTTASALGRNQQQSINRLSQSENHCSDNFWGNIYVFWCMSTPVGIYCCYNFAMFVYLITNIYCSTVSEFFWFSRITFERV